MSSAAKEFLDVWTTQQDHHPPLTDADAAMLAEQWEADARQNGIPAAEVRAAAGGDIAAFLQRTFGREGSELTLD
ncbi:hypothetical protein [Sphingomonas prati]|uniref:DUF768 domain-containing protein n=1 Tax=Sphingomonas prati TaxID=1843237 RepID=A0A7W9BSL1_9SPHN|nr:hypothetical protein [Sphingomonas prati]MBB5729382.1 hypothetical protein [Sphingomonas prati]GGE77852.1 hypothetical protein GCM10011404_08220 [Sphingomonas prati]